MKDKFKFNCIKKILRGKSGRKYHLDKNQMNKAFNDYTKYLNNKQLTTIEIIKKLEKLYNQIKINRSYEIEDIFYIGYCRGKIKETGKLLKKDMLKLNKLWIKYKK